MRSADRDRAARRRPAVPLKVSVPLAGSVMILTARKALAGLSFGSLKPKSAGGERVGRADRGRA